MPPDPLASRAFGARDYRDERRDEFWQSGWHRHTLPAVFSTS